MQLAIVNNKCKEAFPNGRGRCPMCDSEVIAKCGPRKINHWAHYGRRDCDPWWENETPWHREWKNHFPESCREVSHVAADGEIHRADIKTQTGIVIEIQHSNMTDAERMSREDFYRNLAWVIDGSGFRKNFYIYHQLPSPDSEIAQDIVWAKAKKNMNGANSGMFFRLSEALVDDPKITKATLRGGWVHAIREIKEELKKSYRGHHQYDWVRPRSTWLEANCPVYIDFGDDLLIKLETYDASGLPCIRYVSKEKFIYDAMIENEVRNIATRFFPIETNKKP